MILESRNFEGYIVKKFVRQERMFFTNEDGLLERNHQEIIESNKIILPNYMEVVGSIDYDFGVMRIRNGRIEILNLMSKSEESRKETARILSEYDPKRKVEVVLLDGMYDLEELEALKVRVRPGIEALMKQNGQNRGADHTEFSILKEAIRVYTDNYCSDCGKKQNKLDVHHIVAEEFNGTHNEENNLVGLCGGREDGKTEKGGKGMCHGKWQNKIKEGIIFPGIFDGELWMSVATKKKEEGKEKKTEIDENEAIACDQALKINLTQTCVKIDERESRLP
jgi:5-methylcytosine-specific restriction endonuclease McrA